MTCLTKESADYGRGMKARHCALCRHFQTPNRCARVVGTISPQAWCRLFAKKE